MTNKRLAELMKVHPNTISNLKNHDLLPHVGAEMMDALCKFLECTPFDLIEYIPEQSTQNKTDESETE
jgi:putative transcriptional regulator